MTASKTPAAPDVTLRQSARWLPADMDTPISLFLGMCHEHHGIVLPAFKHTLKLFAYIFRSAFSSS